MLLGLKCIEKKRLFKLFCIIFDVYMLGFKFI